MNDTLTCAIIGHLVGDYLLQNDWMALNKKENQWACTAHVFIWTTCVFLFAGWGPSGGLDTAIGFFVLFELHYWQDATGIVVRWMKFMGQSRFMQSDQIGADAIEVDGGRIERRLKVIPGLGPWSIIVVDNVWHIVTIWAVWKFIINN